MNIWMEIAILMVLFAGAMLAVVIFLSRAIQRQGQMMIDAIQSMPVPTVHPETIVKYYQSPAEKHPLTISRTPEGIVAEWAAQMEAAGSPVSDQERADQKELWSQNEEYL